MTVINRYITKDFLISFLMTLAVLTFVMYVGTVIKAIDYISRGVSGWLVLKMFALNVPFTLSFTIPMSVLTSVLLHFGRLSVDGEITAMKASGVSLWQIASPVLFISILLSLACLFINAEVSPRSHYARRQMKYDLGDEDPLSLLDEGRFVKDFPGVHVHVGKKSADLLEKIIIYQYDNGLKARVHAERGYVNYDPSTMILEINLEDVRMTEVNKADPLDVSKARTLEAKSYPLRLDLNEMMKKKAPSKKASDMTFFELINAIRYVRQANPNLKEEDVPLARSKMATEANQRLALAFSCFAFTLVAIPLGIRSHRKESSIGIAIALVIAFCFYLFIIISDTLVKYPQFRPDLIPWIPVVASELIGYILLRKNR